jgi:hypothetical protein
MSTVVAEYLRAVRVAHTAVRKYSGTSRVYLSLEHHWMSFPEPDPLHGCRGREFIDIFNRLAQEGGDFDWAMAYHPYPENLFEPRTWLDKQARAEPMTPKITFKNLDQLTTYFKRPELLHRGKPRHIILSEQGFNTPNKPEGETWQAAGFCYAYYKVAHLDGIDAFILHRHVDNKGEGGLNLGLWSREPASYSTPLRKKKIYDIFRLADTPDWERAFDFAKPLIGITNWAQILPNAP